MIKASDEELEGSIESCERWEWFGGGLVFFGVIATVVIAAAHPRYDSFWEQWGSAIADSFVAAGVAIEIKFGQMAGLRQNELRRRSDEKVSEANARAAEAELRTEKLRSELSWRRISSAEIDYISKFLAEFPKYSIMIEFVEGDPETNTFAHDIGATFSRCGWTVGFNSCAYFGETAFGIRAPLYAPPNTDACGIARTALSRAGIKFTGELPPESHMMSGSGENVGSPCAHMYVGPKPMPTLE